VTRPPKRVAGHQALQVWLGRWRAEGTVFHADGSTSPWLSDESYEFLDGGFFVIQRWNEHGGDEPFVGVGVLSYDLASDEYAARSFENHGHYRHYEVWREDNVWTFSGELERARYEFAADGATCEVHWECRAIGQNEWRTLCVRTARRVED
jgi:hypothetical protein